MIDRSFGKVMTALAATALMASAAGSAVAAPRREPSKAAVEGLKAAYYNILEFEKCVVYAPDSTDPDLVPGRNRTIRLVSVAQGKSLQSYLDQAAAKWRYVDSVADKACYFQMTEFKGTSALLLRGVNDQFQSAIARF